MTTAEQVDIVFKSGGLADQHVRLLGVHGREELSELFGFELYLARDEGGLSSAELDALLRAPCAIALGDQEDDLFFGVLQHIRMLDTSGTLPPRYVARMVPSVWLTALNHQSRIFQHVTVPDVVQAILTSYGLTPGRDFQLRLSASYEEREYLVQYEESDWQLIERWLEREGIFYWFEHRDRRDVLVLADDNSATPLIASPTELRYRARNNLDNDGEDTVWQWSVQQQRTPARVAVFDYNHRTPAHRLVAKQAVDEARGFGSVMLYNEHFKDLGKGQQLARVRAERLLQTRRTFTGWSDCPRLRGGHRFALTDHFINNFDDMYLITRIEHHAGVPVPYADTARSYDELEQTWQPYKAALEALPASTAYRPDRDTPWPRIRGVIHGHVEADDAGEYATIDAQGRYKVRFPFDAGNAAGASSSRWIRMTQRSSGVGYGSHFPLHKGAEVIVTHIDGDPDRPVIVGTVPHAHTPSPVTSENLSQSVIHTPSGLRIELEDLGIGMELPTSDDAGDGYVGDDTSPQDSELAEEERTWIEIQLFGEDGLPVTNQRYKITAPGGSVWQGILDDEGVARVDGILPGNCEITFPDLDEEAWTPM